jgi:CAAX protease family protein
MLSDNACPPARPASRDAVALVIAALFPALGTWLYFHTFAGRAELKVVFTASKVVQFAFPIAWVWLVQRQAIQFHQPTRKGILAGLAFAALLVGTMVGSYLLVLRESRYLSGADTALWNKLGDIGITTPVEFIALAVFYSVPHAFLEEYYWRWFVFGQARRFMPWPVAAGLSGLAFALHHVIVIAAYVPPEHFWTATLFFSLCVGAGGAVWAWIYQRSGSLYATWLSHLLIDAGIMWIGFDLCRRYWT